jgi:amino acid transporter
MGMTISFASGVRAGRTHGERGSSGDRGRTVDDRVDAAKAAPRAGPPGEPTPQAQAAGAPDVQKGLKSNAIGYLSSTVIGVASTAPAYSLAASLGFVTAAVGLQSPAIMIVAFIPMLFVAASYYYLNRADPDAGTTFSWVTRAMGPSTGWVTGWIMMAADVIVMANLAEIAGLYTFYLVGWDSAANNVWAVTALGVVWIVVMTVICALGIELSTRTQYVLMGAEVTILVAFSIVALVRVFAYHPPGSVTPSFSWLNPFQISGGWSAVVSGVLVAIFIYWGWDTTVSVTEETRDTTRTPGKAAIMSTLVLVAIYVVTSVASQAMRGAGFLTRNSDDTLSALGKIVFGSPWDKLLIVAVLTSSAASTLTTLLPLSRTSLSMAAKGAFPRVFKEIDARFLTPAKGTVIMGVLSIVWYVGLTALSQNVLYDSIAALGLMIAFYYGITGYAAIVYYRRIIFRSARNFFLIGATGLLGGLLLTGVFVKSCIDLSNPANSESGDSWFGLGPPLVIGLAFMVFGVIGMVVSRLIEPAFFRRKIEVWEGADLPETPMEAEVPAAVFDEAKISRDVVDATHRRNDDDGPE